MSLFLPRAARGAVSGAATIALAAHTSMPKSCAAATAAAAATAQNLRPTTTVGALLIAAVEPSELRWSATAVKAGGGAAPGSLHAAALSATTVAPVLSGGGIPSPLLVTALGSRGAPMGTRFAHTSAAAAVAAAAVPSIVAVKVGNGRAYLPFAAEGLMDMNATDLLEALDRRHSFSSDFQGVPFCDRIVTVIKNAALTQGNNAPPAESTENEAANVLEMAVTDTVGSMARAVGAHGVPLYVHVRLPPPPSPLPPPRHPRPARIAVVADAACFPPPPAPITFTKAGFSDPTGSPMHVTTLEDGSPFYLDDLALQKVKDWASGSVSDAYADQKLVVLTGPIKSGKTTLLKLLPRFLARDSPRTPVVLRHTFSLRQGPRPAAVKLVQAARGLAKELGFTISTLPIADKYALHVLDLVIRDLAKGIYAAGGEFILLLDEAQAPILAARSPADAMEFATKIKDIHTECRATTRIAITGSAMIALLNSLRSLPPNGYALWGAMSRVHLGATPDPVAADTMAKAIITARAAWWPPPVQALVTADFVLGKLSQYFGSAASAGLGAPQVPAARPALVAFLADLMGSAAVGEADAIAEAAIEDFYIKLQEETTLDAAVALASLDEPLRRTMYYLAAGQLDLTTLKSRVGGRMQQRFTQLLQTLCEPIKDPSATIALLPPYEQVFTSILDNDGALLVEWNGRRWELTETLRDRLKFFGEHYTELLQRYRPVAEAVSAAVLRAMAADGHGIATSNADSPLRPVTTLKEMESLPAFRGIRSVLNAQESLKSDGKVKLAASMATFSKRMSAAAPDASPSADEQAAAEAYTSVMGMYVLVWLRHIDAHAYISKDELIDAKLTVGVLDHWVRAALAEMKGLGFRFNRMGVPVIPRAKVAALPASGTGVVQ